MDLRDVSFFVSVVETGGISAAARALSAPKSSVSRGVARLENNLGVRLLHRSTRSLTPTEAGQSFYERVSVALREMNEAASAAIEAREVPKGTVRVSAPLDVGAEVLPHLVARFVESHPEVTVEVELSADAPSLIQGGFDLALRGGPQPDSGLIARKLQDTLFKLYASPAYVAKTGAPANPEDLSEHQCILSRSRNGRDEWRLRGSRGLARVVVRGSVVANDLSFIRRAAVAGSGIALLPDIVGSLLVRNGVLREVLADYHASGYPLYIVYPSRKHVPLRVRALRDFIVESFPREDVDPELAANAIDPIEPAPPAKG